MSVSPEPSLLSTVAHRAPTSSRTASPTRHTPFSTGPPPCARRTPRSRTPTTCPTSPCTSSCAGGPVRLDEICVVLVHAGEHDRGVRGRFAYVDRLNRHPVDAAGVKALGGPGGVVVLEFREGVAAGGGLHGGVVPVHGPIGPPRRPVVGDVGHHDLPLGLVQALGDGHHEVIRVRIRQRLRRHIPRHGRRFGVVFWFVGSVVRPVVVRRVGGAGGGGVWSGGLLGRGFIDFVGERAAPHAR